MLLEFQVARESYLQWLADQEKSRGKTGSGRNPPPAATVPSGQMSPRAAATCSSVSGHVSSSPRGSSSPRPRGGGASNSPKAGCSYHQSDQAAGGRDSPVPGSSRSLQSSSKPQSSHAQDHGLGPGFHLRETASYLNGLPPDLFGKNTFN